jgi:hypothetical protein
MIPVSFAFLTERYEVVGEFLFCILLLSFNFFLFFKLVTIFKDTKRILQKFRQQLEP